LDQRNMLVRRRMEYGVGTPAVEQASGGPLIGDVAEFGDDVDLRRVELSKFGVDQVECELRMLDEDETFRQPSDDLATQFAADGAARSCDQNHTPGDRLGQQLLVGG